MYAHSQDKYWAAEEGDKAADYLLSMVTKWQTYSGTSTTGMSATWIRNVIAYYSSIINPQSWETALGFEGEQGELVRMTIPRARTIIRQIVGLVAHKRLDFQSVSQSNDLASINASRIAEAIAKQVITKQDLESKAEMCMEEALVLGMSFMKTGWRSDRGIPYVPEEGGKQIRYTGDIYISNHNLFNVVWDTSKPNWTDQDWVIVRTPHNRWDLAAQYPKLKDKILNLPTCTNEEGEGWWFYLKGTVDEETVYINEFYHRPTPSMPKGRMMVFGDADTILYDEANPYECLPVEPMIPEKIHNTGLGYPIISNLLPSQEMFDNSYSAIATNQSANAVQMYAAPRGSDIDAADIAGMNFLMYSPQNAPGGGKPEPLQLTQSAPETFKFADMLEGQMMKQANLNNALIGEPPPGVTAGNAIATLTYNALRFMDPYNKTFTKCLERIMTKSVKIFSKFATVETFVPIVGRNNRTKVMSFVGSDLSPVDHIKLNIQSPMLETIGGRVDLAEKIMPWGLIKNGQQLISLLEGAPLETLYEDELTENDSLEAEKDAILEGQQPSVVITQNHPRHIRSLSTMLQDPNIQGMQDMVQMITELIQEHLHYEQTMDPMLKAITRTGQAPQQPPPGAPPGGPQQADQGAGQEMLEQGELSAQDVSAPADQATPLIGAGA